MEDTPTNRFYLTCLALVQAENGTSNSSGNFCEDIRSRDHNTYVRELINYYLMGIGAVTVCCMGLIGNILSLVVLCQKTMRSSTYSYLAALAVCDILMLVCTLVIVVKDIAKPIEGQQRWPWGGVSAYLFPVLHPMAFTFQVTSVWLTLAFTVDRYIMICHPFEAEPFCTVSRARKVVAILYVGSILFNIPKFFEYKTVAVTDLSNITKIGCDLTDFGNSAVFRKLYHWWFYIAFVCGVPFLSLAVLNAFLIHAVHKSRQRGRDINAAERKRNDTTIMLISVVVVFFICQMPALVSRIIWAFEDDTFSHKRIHLYALNEVGNMLVILNSAINIVPYYFFGRRFRKLFWRLFCRCLLKYKRFHTLTRSFSITVLEANRKDSNGSVPENCRLHPHVTTVTGANESIKMTHLLRPEQELLPRKPSVLSTASDCCYDKHEKLPKKAQGSSKAAAGCKTVEVNGNCQTKDPALDCLLERD